MATTFYDYGRLWHCGSDDILTFNIHTDENSGLAPITIRKLVHRPAATGNSALFYTLSVGKAPTVTVSNVQIDITNTATLTDALTGACFNGGAVGDWVYITKSTTGTSLGWYYLTTFTNTSVIVIENTTNALTNETGGYFDMFIYRPELCMATLTMTSGAAGEKLPFVLDWGDDGREFANLGMKSKTGGTVDIYLL